MSTGVIIAIVVVVVIALVAIASFARMRGAVRRKQRERELGRRRDTAADVYRDAATDRNRHADAAEERARLAELEAQRERAEAELHAQHAQVHEQGLADDELIREDERDKFEGAGSRAGRSDARTSGTRRA
jgi:biopolymer transport protein ExbB/TolQ